MTVIGETGRKENNEADSENKAQTPQINPQIYQETSQKGNRSVQQGASEVSESMEEDSVYKKKILLLVEVSWGDSG